MTDVSYPLAGQRIKVAPSTVLSSPGFAASYPRIINPEVLSPGAKANMESTWNLGAYPERTLEVFHLQDVFVIDECLIFNRELQVIENASDPYTEKEVSRAIGDIRRWLASSELPHYPRGVISKRRAAGNYGHYLMEMLPMAAIGKQQFGQADRKYLVHRVEPPLLDVVLRSFRLLGVGLNQLLIKDEREPVHFEELIIVRGLTVHGTYMSPLAVRETANIGAGVPPGHRRRLFVRRLPGWERGRTLLNEDQVAVRLAGRGFEAIEPGSMSLEEQISAFRGADDVIGVSGAAMTNIVFCKPGTNVTVLVPARFPDTFFWFIATHRQLNYAELRGRQLALDGEDNWKADFSLSESEIQYLEQSVPDAKPASVTVSAVVLTHVQNFGDIKGELGNWIGAKGSGCWIEGFCVTPQAGIDRADIEYQAVMANDQVTPWTAGGTYCGSRNKSASLRGFRLRLTGVAAGRVDCCYSATFIDGTVKELVPAGTICVSDSRSPLESLRITIRPLVSATRGHY